MKKIIIAVICIILLCAATVPVFATDSAQMTVTTSATDVKRGDTVTVDVSISKTEKCTNAGFMFTFDTDVFEYVSGQALVSASDFMMRGVSTMNGKISGYFGGAQSDVTVEGTIFQITLKVKNDAAFGAYTITGTPSLPAGGAKVDCTAKGATVNVVCTHNYSAWTKVDDNNHKHVCSICQKEETATHTWNSGAVTKQPTCKDEGVKTYTCTDCNATKTEAINKTTDHKYGAWTKVDDNNHKHVCSICQKEETATHTWNSGEVTKQPTCKEEGVKTYTCTACNVTKTESIDKLTTHNYGNWIKVDDNTHKHTCSICQKEETTSHNWNSGVVTKEPTCNEEGIKTFTCAGCNASKTEGVAKITDHKYDNACDTACNVCGKTRTITHNYSTKWSTDKTNHWHACTICGDKKDLTAHTPGTAATETKAQTCTTCGYVIKAALGHTHKYSNVLTYDGTNHWYACSGCSEKKSLAKHSFTNACDAKCDACGYTRTITHSYGQTWVTDGNNHWHECSVCHDKKDMAAHESGAAATETTAQTCTICAYVIKEALGHTHNFGNTWVTDDINHWRTCACGEKADEAAHTWDGSACSGCGMLKPAEPTEPTEPSTEPVTNPQMPTEPAGTDNGQPDRIPDLLIVIVCAIVAIIALIVAVRFTLKKK